MYKDLWKTCEKHVYAWLIDGGRMSTGGRFFAYLLTRAVYKSLVMPVSSSLFPLVLPQLKPLQSPLFIGSFSALSPAPITITTS